VSAPVPHGNDAVVIPAAALSVATDQPDVGGDGGGDPPGRPALIVTDVNHADLTNERTRILAAANEPPYLFVVGDTLARVNIGEAGLPQIELVPPPALRYRVAAVVDTVSVTRNGVKKIIPPLALMQAVLSLHDAPFPLLAGITGSPFVQSDHQLVADGGYDHTSGLLYVPAPGFSLPRMSTCPTREESHRACQHRPNLDPFAPAES
jgi:hypothetical protein